MKDYLEGYEAGQADADAGRDWADNTGKSYNYIDGYAAGYRS